MKRPRVNVPMPLHALVTLRAGRKTLRINPDDMDAFAAAWLVRRLKTARPKTQENTK